MDYEKADKIFLEFCKKYMELTPMLPVTTSELEVLNIVAKRKGQYFPAVIANIMDVSKARVAKLVSSLEEKEYVYKEFSKNDKRIFYVMPTQKARMLVKEVEDRRKACLTEIERQLGTEEFAMLTCLLEEAKTIATQYSRL